MTKLPDTPRKVGGSTVSRPKEPEIGGSNDEDLKSPEGEPHIPLIFVMGVSGAGKSSFIKTLEGKDPEGQPPATSATESVTRQVEAYKTILGGQEMLLVDTPGFEDNKTSNLETLQKICEHILQVANNPAYVIRGAVYVHNIATSRWTAGDKRTWSILKALCGEAAMGNVIVATTRWPAGYEEEDYGNLEKRNLEKYWEGILETVRLAKNDVENSRAIIRMLLRVLPKPFQVEWELSGGKTPSDTSAGRITMAEGEEALSRAGKEKEYALAELERISSRVEQVRSQNAPKLTPPPPLEAMSLSTANFEEEMDALLQRLESAIHADKSQLKKIESSEKTLQEDIRQIQASLKEKECLLEKYHKLRPKVEFVDKLKAMLSALRIPISIPKISMGRFLEMVLGGMVVMQIGSAEFHYCGFAVTSGVLLYERVSEKANPTPKNDSQASQEATQTSDMEYQIPTMNIQVGEGVGLNDGSGGNG